MMKAFKILLLGLFALVSTQSAGQQQLFLNKTAGAPPVATDFRILVNTANAGVSNNDQFQFTGALGDYNVEVWDQTGTTLQETITGLSDAATITIAAGAGMYELRVFAAVTNGFNRIQFANGGDKDKLIEVRNWGNVAWSTMRNAFWACSNLTSITSSVQPDLSSVASFRSFARNCGSLATFHLSNWNTSSVTNFSLFLDNCSSLNTLDVSGWDTQNVVDFSFFAQNSSSLADIVGIESFNVSSVTDFTNFLTNVTLPTSRYDQLLINYEAQAPNTELSFNGGNSKYTAGGAAEAARTNLINTYNWNISDGGPL